MRARSTSLSLGLVSVFLSLALGVVLGGISGYRGGAIDTFIQRVIEFIRTIPTIPLWMTLSAALPADWPVIRVYFGISVILSLVGYILFFSLRYRLAQSLGLTVVSLAAMAAIFVWLVP